jgi:hypothetical protein
LHPAAIKLNITANVIILNSLLMFFI